MRRDKIKKLFSTSNIGMAFGCIILVLMAMLAVLMWQKTHPKNMQREIVETSKVFHWTGGAGDGKWSTAGNWSENNVPGADAEVVFDAASKADSVVDAEFTEKIAALQIKGYDAKITQNFPLTITDYYYQDSGEYVAEGNLEVGGDFTQTDDSIFAVMVGDTRIAGELVYNDGFKSPAEESSVYAKVYGEWKMLMINTGGNSDYNATKIAKSSAGVSDTWSFYNATNFLQSYISQEKGWTLGGVDKAWNWSYLFTELSRGGGEKTLNQNLGIVAAGNRVTLKRDENIEEWYENTYKGVEQGFTIKKKPAGEGELIVKGIMKTSNLSLVKDENEDVTGFLLSNGGTAVKYGHLSAVDAQGRNLPVKMDLIKVNSQTYELNIYVDDKDAQYPIIVDPISTTEEWKGSGGVGGAQYGKVATLAGDVNGDGKSDFLVTARAYTDTYATEGAAFLYYGTSSGISVTPSWSFKSGILSAQFGHSASAAGDVNDDGYDDVIIAADRWGTYAGRLYLFLGSADGLSDTPDWTYDGTQSGQNLGQSVSNAGDINGDGFDDIIAGAHFYSESGKLNLGKVLVFYGNISGLSNVPDWTMVGESNNAMLGFSVSEAGDINRDGYSDVLIGAPGASKAYLYYGSATGLSTLPRRVFADAPAGSYFGNPVSLGGDLNNDTYPDVLIGASRYDNIATDAGAVFAYYGGASGLAASPSWSSYGTQANAYYGCGYYTAGDVNGDGFSDVVVGACMYDGEGGGPLDFPNEGKASVFLGSSTGLVSTPVWSREGNYADASFGWYASTAGNVNGDGAGDFLVSAYKYQNATVGGQAYLFLGSDEVGGWQAEVCTGGVDEDNDGLIDGADPDCDTGVDKSNITVNVSTTEQDDWFDDRCRDGVDNDHDGLLDHNDPDCDGGAANDANLTTYVVCDSILSSYDSKEAKNSYIHPYIRDYEYTPCDRDDVHDDYFSTDSSSPVFVQPSEKKFTINATASDSNGLQSIMIQWMNGNTADWTKSKSKICNSTGSCTVCVKGGNCGAGNDVIDFASLGIPEGKIQQRLYFRVVVTDNLNNVVATGDDDNIAVSPVLDKYYRLVICSKDCHACQNPAPLVTLDRVQNDTDCAGLNYTLHWNFSDNSPGQAYYELQVREKNNPAAPVLSTVRASSDTFARLFNGFLSGSLDYEKEYEWRVRAYDNSIFNGVLEEGCQAVSDWTPWSPAALTFTTPTKYPAPSFTMDVVDSSTCSICGYSKTATFTSNSTVYDGSTPLTDWYIGYDGIPPTINTQLNPVSVTYTDETQLAHDIKLIITDGGGRSCEMTQTLSLGKGNPVWNEVAPSQD